MATYKYDLVGGKIVVTKVGVIRTRSFFPHQWKGLAFDSKNVFVEFDNSSYSAQIDPSLDIVILSGVTIAAGSQTSEQLFNTLNSSSVFQKASGGGGATTSASDLTSGTLPDARLSNNVVKTNDTQTLANKTLTSPIITNPTGITKGDLGLGNVDNTSDASKPISTATQTALNSKANNVITGYVSGAGTVSATDTVVQAINKLNGNTITRATLASPAFTGTPTAPTATVGTNTTQLATTAFVLANAAGITLTTNGTTGASTFNTSTKVLNIPNYSGASPTQAAALGYVDVTTLGIPSGAHTTDDRSTFQDILYSQKKIYIPAGVTINLTNVVYGQEGQDVIGSGMGKSVIRALNWTGGTEQSLMEYNGLSNIKFEGIKFTGNAVQMKSALKFNPFPNKNKNLKIYNCVFQDLWSHGVYFGSGDSTDQWYEQIDIAQNYFNKLYDPAHIIVPDEDLVNLKCVGVWLASHTKKAMIHHNFFEDQSGDAVHAFGTTPATGEVPLDPEWRRLDISHNYIYQTWMGIELNGNKGTANGSSVCSNIIIHIRRPNGAGFGISFAGDHSKINDNIIVTTEMSGLEIFGNNNEIHNNHHRFSVFKTGSGGASVPDFNSGATSVSNLEVYGSNVSIKNNVFNNDVYYDNGTVTTRQVNGINVINKSPYSPASFEGISDYATGYDIQGNHIHGVTKSFVESTVQPIRKVHIWDNHFSSKNLSNSAIWVQGFDWTINHNYFDLDGSPNGFVDGIGLVMVHNQATNTRSFVFGNTVRNENWFFPVNTRALYKYWNNQFINSSTYVGWTDYLHFPVTAAERTAISIKLGTQQTVTQTDGGAAAGTYNYVNGAWVKQ